MKLRRKSPRLLGLAGFEEKKVPGGFGYLAPSTAVTGIGILDSELATYVAGYRQIPDIELVGVIFGDVTGWKIGQGKRIGYLLTKGDHSALLNVDPRGSEPIDVDAVEASLHTLHFP